MTDISSLVQFLIIKLCSYYSKCVPMHGPSVFAVKAKIYGVLYNQAGLIAFDETSSYWSALKSF